MYENLILPKDKNIKQCLLDSLDFDTSYLLKQTKKLNVNNDVSDTSFNQLTDDIQQDIFWDVLSKISYSESIKFVCNIKNRNAFKALEKLVHESVVKYTTLVKKNVKAFKFIDFVKNPLLSFDTNKLDYNLTDPKEKQDAHKNIVILVYMLKSGNLDIIYKYLDFVSYQTPQFLCEVESVLRTDAPDQSLFQAQKKLLMKNYSNFQLNSVNTIKYKPLMKGLFDMDSTIIHFIEEPEKQYALIKQQYTSRYSDPVVRMQRLSEKLINNLQQDEDLEYYFVILRKQILILCGWNDLKQHYKDYINKTFNDEFATEMQDDKQALYFLFDCHILHFIRNYVHEYLYYVAFKKWIEIVKDLSEMKDFPQLLFRTCNSMRNTTLQDEVLQLLKKAYPAYFKKQSNRDNFELYVTNHYDLFDVPHNTELDAITT